MKSGTKWGKVVVVMFTGEYRHSIDEKNRLIVPKNFRDDLGMKIVITRGLDGCLFGYNIETWNKLLEKLNTLPFTKMLVILRDSSLQEPLLWNSINKEG